MPSGEEASALVVFDETSGRARRFAAFLQRHDHRKRLRIAARDAQTELDSPPPRPLLLRYRGRLYDRSDAVLRSLYLLGGAYAVAAFLLLVPGLIRDLFRPSLRAPRPPRPWYEHLFVNGCTHLSLAAFRILLYAVVLGELVDIARWRDYTLDPGAGPTLILVVAFVGCLLRARRRRDARRRDRHLGRLEAPPAPRARVVRGRLGPRALHAALLPGPARSPFTSPPIGSSPSPT